MNNTKQKRNWILDVLLWVGFLSAFFLDFTGLEFHQWLGVALGLMATIHLVRHFNWLKAAITRLSRRALKYILLDIFIAGGFAVILGSGLIISTWLNLPLENYAIWKNIHVIISVATLMAILGKVGLHWRWIALTTQKFFNKGQKVLTPPVAEPVVISSQMIERRKFLTMMGVASLVTAVSIYKVLKPEQAALAETTTNTGSNSILSTSQPTATQVIVSESNTSNLVSQPTQSGVITVDPTSTQVTVVTASPTSTPVVVSYPATTCTVQCNRGCSYPGHCRRYTDANQNGKCDLGECA